MNRRDLLKGLLLAPVAAIPLMTTPKAKKLSVGNAGPEIATPPKITTMELAYIEMVVDGKLVYVPVWEGVPHAVYHE